MGRGAKTSDFSPRSEGAERAISWSESNQFQTVIFRQKAIEMIVIPGKQP